MKFLRLTLIILSLIGILLLVGIFLIGSTLVAPQQRDVGEPPVDLAIEKVSFFSESSATVKGWWTAQPSPKANILLLHGIRADRRSMLGRSRFLSAAGYNVLLIDLQAHGESIGDKITLGKLESLDVAAALNYLSEKAPDIPIGIIGSSLGGASAILCKSEVEVKAIVVEAVFPTPRRAIDNRLEMKLGKFGKHLSPLLSKQIPWRLGTKLKDISPIMNIGNVQSAILIINGSEDRRTTKEEAQSLYQHANQPKELWIVPNAAHVNLHKFAKREYENRVLKFLAEHF